MGLHKVLQYSREAAPEQDQMAYMDDAYAVCHKDKAKGIIDGFAVAAQHVGMELHLGKIQIYNAGDRDALPEELRYWWVDNMTILGNQADRADVHPPRLEAKGSEESSAFRELIVKVEWKADKIVELRQHGVSLQTAQALSRLIAATRPQYIMRSTLIPMDQRKMFDRVTIKIWVMKVFAGTPAASDPLVHEHLHLPIAWGGVSAGGIVQKAPAGFISGTVAELPEIHRAAKTNGVDGPQRVHPRKRLTIAIHSSEGVAGMYLSAPAQETHKVSDVHFQIAAMRGCGHQCLVSGPQCRKLKQNGERCGAHLDEHGHHGAICEYGGALVRRHYGVRDLLLRRLAEHLGASAHIEQRVASMACGGRREARLDVAVTVPGATTHYLDVAVVEVYSSNAGVELQRAGRLLAAEAMEGNKRNKYGANDRMIPLVVEAHGRLGPAAMRWLGKAYKGFPDLRRMLLQELAAAIQCHTAAMVVASAC